MSGRIVSTPLHHAIQNGHVSLVESLLKDSKSTTLSDGTGMIEYAKHFKNCYCPYGNVSWCPESVRDKVIDIVAAHVESVTKQSSSNL